MLKARDQKEKNLRKQLILDSAEVVLERRGLHKLSISAVAKEAKLAQGTLYLYFSKKEDIIAQLTIRSRQKLLALFHQAIEKTEDPLEQLRNILQANFKFYNKYRLYYELVNFYKVNAEENEPPELKQTSRNISALVASVLDRAKTQGLIRPSINVAEFTYIAWAMCNGMVQMVDLSGPQITSELNKPTEDFYTTYVNFVIEGIRAH